MIYAEYMRYLIIINKAIYMENANYFNKNSQSHIKVKVPHLFTPIVPLPTSCLLFDVMMYSDISMHFLTSWHTFYAPGDDSPHGGILLLLCPYVRTYVCPSLVKVFG